jgi:nucleotide-binding universal stress UspA family protein/hemerythrin-like domain-containing protein
MSKRLQPLYDEHRTIAAVLGAMKQLVRNQRERGAPIDCAAFRSMIYYLDVFPERVHHPKEEHYLFEQLAARSAEAQSIVEELGREHARGADAIRRLQQALVRYEEAGEREFEELAKAVEGFVDQYYAHMRKEESELMPLAEQVFTSEEWAQCETAFATHHDPLHGARDEKDLAQLYARLQGLMPLALELPRDDDVREAKRRSETRPSAAPALYQHILIPTDGSPVASLSIRSGVGFAKYFGARITGVHVYPSADSISSRVRKAVEQTFEKSFEQHARAQGGEFLAEIEQVAREAGVPCDSVIVRENVPYRGILQTAEERGCDLIFMGSRGAHGLESLLAGSQTQKVLQNAKISVMVYR